VQSEAGKDRKAGSSRIGFERCYRFAGLKTMVKFRLATEDLAAITQRQFEDILQIVG
jgi:hypothetical protein